MSSGKTGEPCRSVWAEENNIIWDFYIVRGGRAVVALAQGASEKDPLREDVRGQRRVSRSPWAWETCARVPEHEQIGLGMPLLLGRCDMKRPLDVSTNTT